MVEVAERPVERATLEQRTIGQRIADVVGGLNVLHGELVALTAHVAESGEWLHDGGARSLEHWLCWQAGCSPSTARDLVALANARTTHPKLSARLIAGELTVDQTAAAIKAPPEHDETMASLAPMSTVRQIRVEVRAAHHAGLPILPADVVAGAGDAAAELVRSSAAAAGAPAGTAAAQRPDETVAQGFDGADQWWLSARLDAERGAIVRVALEEAHDRLFRNGRHDVTWADALVDIAARSLVQLPDSRHDHYRVNLFLPLDAPVTLTDRTSLPECVARHLTCDGVVSPVFTEDSAPVAVGRTQRVVPERTRRLVLHRDGESCGNPTCGSRFGLEIHHIVHWLDGGSTDPDNLVTLCAACHRSHHRGRLGISGNADEPSGVVFTDARGQPLRRPRPNPPPSLPPPANRYRHPLGEPLDRRALYDAFPSPPNPN